MVTVLSLASARSRASDFSVNGQIRLQNSARQTIVQTAAAAIMIMIVLTRWDSGDDLGFVLPGPVGGAAELVRAGDDMNLGLRNACELLASYLHLPFYAC